MSCINGMKNTILLLFLGSCLVLVSLSFWLSREDSLPHREKENKEARATTNITPTDLRKLVTSTMKLGQPDTSSSDRIHANEKVVHIVNTSLCREMQDKLLFASLRKRYSEDYYIQTVMKVQNCTWKRQPEECRKFRLELSSCCNAVRNFIVSQNNTLLGSNMRYEVDSKRNILIAENIFRMLPQDQPFSGYPFKHCAVVGNGGNLKNSSCGDEINESEFVFRCNLPPILGNITKDVGNKTNLVTVNPSIIALKYGKLKENKISFLENITSYGEAFLLLPAFSYRTNTALSFKVYHTLREFHAKQKAIFFHPKYLKSLAQFWRTKGVRAYRLSSGFMITSAAIELCENVRLYGFWPFSKSIQGKPISHHYYDNQLPKPGFHAMPKEFYQVLQLHSKGILKLQFGECEKR
ncbi:alpha-2,8-sialyltransferase 8F [Microcaecilia unicolor]|uniref:Alpha-2,8-sialyltransferase 8F n=1 Tax=Microcaecilia unicolor TaxID=1415580 RepID=A0A6P7WRH8_9AMPH|nr:alpha-2,8-sialyltransferase 8F [Microcaecilia unicolor]